MFKELLFAGNTDSLASSIFAFLFEILIIGSKFFFKVFLNFVFNLIKFTCSLSLLVIRFIESSLNKIFVLIILLKLVLIDIYYENKKKKKEFQQEEHQDSKIESSKKCKILI